jgi:Protein of unknown function (DUF1579)
MKKIILVACSATMLLISCNDSAETTASKTDTTSTNITANTDVKKDDAWVPVDSATAMKAMMEYGTPGEMHKLLASWNGTWSGETTMWEYEGAAPQKSSGTAVNAMIFDGKYQTNTHKGTMMGMPFEGRGVTAYDNATKKFVSTWIDTWSTGIMNMSGTWDAATKSLTMSGTFPDVTRPGKECTLRQVTTVIDDNTQRFDMYGPDQKTGKEFKMMEITMTRKK